MIFILVGLIALVVCVVAAALFAVPLAAALSYLPYLFYRLLRWRPRLRGVRQLVVFGGLWLVFTMLFTCVLMLGTNIEHVGLHGWPLLVYGYNIFQREVWVAPLVTSLCVGVGGEVSLAVLRRWLPTPAEVAPAPR